LRQLQPKGRASLRKRRERLTLASAVQPGTPQRWLLAHRGTQEPWVIDGEVVVRDGQIATMDIRPVIDTHNRCAA
jgi:hypothetical protein